jgi:S1-C subfamily serine protease
MQRTTAWAALWALGLWGCGSSSQKPAESAEEGELAASASRDVPARPPPPQGSLWRDDVAATVDAGLGWFLQRVEVEPRLEGGTFRGFEIKDLRPSEYWQGIDLRVGDVVTTVNGKPIERETQAYDVFQSLKTASEIRVHYLRNGKDRELVLRIVDPPKEQTASAKTKPSG